VLLLITTTGFALALNNLLWDKIYQGEYYTIVGSFIMLIFPAIWLPSLRFFRRDIEQSSVWRVVAAVAVSLLILILVWVIGETVL
jgi:hypothetical protein